MWHVTLTVVGDAVGAARDPRPRSSGSPTSSRSCSPRATPPDRAELRYWEEARDLEDAAALALRLWGEHRRHRRRCPPGGWPGSRSSTGRPSSGARMDTPAPALVPAGGVRPF